jgi:DNA polymerase I
VNVNKPYNHRNFVSFDACRVIVDENKLDIFYTHEQPIAKWQPDSQSLKPYRELKHYYLDIETSGLNPETDRIYAIGIMNDDYQPVIFMDYIESKILVQFLDFLEKFKIDVLHQYNGLRFDLPFIIAKLKKYKLKNPFWVSPKTRIIDTAREFGEPFKYNEVFLKGVNLFDAYIGVLRWDNREKKLQDTRSLKRVVLDTGLRSEQRLELNHHQVKEYWKDCKHGWEKIKEYLIYDLQDTKLVSDFVAPNFYYQAEVIPSMSLQSLLLSGNAYKWSKRLDKSYLDLGHNLPQPDNKLEFTGGFVSAKPGLHRKGGKIDVRGMYAYLMLKYGICSIKDRNAIALSILLWLLEKRIALKVLAYEGDKQADDTQNSLKEIINSLFGLYGTKGCAFNDMQAAALITAYGRRLLKLMIGVIECEGGVPVEVDTDGIFFTHENPHEVFTKVQAALPEGIFIELETIADAIYIPHKGKKNYLVWTAEGKIIRKGYWRSRARCKFELNFPVEFLTKYLSSPQEAEQYYQQVQYSVLAGEVPVKDLQVTRKIRRGEKAILVLGSEGDIVTFYHGNQGLTNSGDYSKSYYLAMVNKKYRELMKVIQQFSKVQSAPHQLSLFIN